LRGDGGCVFKWVPGPQNNNKNHDTIFALQFVVIGLTPTLLQENRIVYTVVTMMWRIEYP
jgi:hypothetical protein